MASAHLVAQSVHWWLGAHYDQKKLQLSRSPTILGVTYDLEQMVLLIKESRKSELLEEIDRNFVFKCSGPRLGRETQREVDVRSQSALGETRSCFLAGPSRKDSTLDRPMTLSLWTKL